MPKPKRIDYDTFASKVCIRLRRGRKAADYTQLEAASELGASESYISLLERGKRMPTLEVIYRLSKIYKLPLSTFIRDGD